MRRRFLIVLPMILAACSPGLPSPAATVLASATTGSGVTPSSPVKTQMVTPPSLPEPSGYTWTLMTGGLDQPVDLKNADDDRLFVVERPGLIRIVRQGRVLSDPFLDIRDRVGDQGSEQGLLGLAFHPRFPQNGSFFLDYTDLEGNTVIARYLASGDRADPASESVLLHIDQPFPNHNGGGLAFGPDGFLYIGMGDGGSEGDPQGNAQNTESLLGKLLRIDVDAAQPYGIPADNPFAHGGGRPEIWAFGLRNPWRFSFDRLTGDLYIGDVGQDLWEEIDFQSAGAPGGANYGWNLREGLHAYAGDAKPSFVDPVAEYGHDQGCSVTGGVVVRDPTLPAWQGVYLFGDFCSGRIWGLVRRADHGWQNAVLFETGLAITSFGEDAAGGVYVLDYAGSVYRLAPK